MGNITWYPNHITDIRYYAFAMKGTVTIVIVMLVGLLLVLLHIPLNKFICLVRHRTGMGPTSMPH